MTKVNLNLNNDSLAELVSRVVASGERIEIEQQGELVAILISSAELKRLEAIDTILKQAEFAEYEWLKAAVKNPAFEFLKDAEEDIYTVEDGEPFHDSEWIKTVVNNPTSTLIIDSEADIYTLADGEPFHDEG